MNLDQLTHVQQRDARYADEARGYAAVRRADDYRDARRRDNYAQQRDAYAQDLQHYRAERQRYDQEMAQWRRPHGLRTVRRLRLLTPGPA